MNRHAHTEDLTGAEVPVSDFGFAEQFIEREHRESIGPGDFAAENLLV